MLARIGLYLNTIRWLRVSQLGWQMYRRLRPVSNPAQVEVEAIELRGLQPGARGVQPGVYEFRFLNQGMPANPETVDWHPQSMPRLWRYNLHYFDFLAWDVFPDDHKRRYIDNWIASNPVGTVDAWEPYTLSLRLVNWLKYFDGLNDNMPEHWLQSALYQAVWLEANLEFHVLANHLLKNVKALVFAGCVFAGPVGTRLKRKGLELLLREAREQFLRDGGHYERSPMYHCIALEDLLDICNLLNDDDPDEQRFREQIAEIAARALDFLGEITAIDGRIPLFNDSAYGIASEPDQLFAYGNRVLGQRQHRHASQISTIRLSASGYFGYRDAADNLLVDCGEIGPVYQPGHAHCDTLSYVLYMDREPLIVDPGVSGYEGDPNRDYVRSTRAHNTVSLDGAEQSEIWGVFRVARRARARLVHFDHAQASGLIEFAGSHDGFGRLPARALHTRRIVVCPGDSWQIKDELTGSGSATAESFVHLHPDVEASRDADDVWTLSRAGCPVARLTLDGEAEASQSVEPFCPEFGLTLEHRVLRLRCHGPLPLCFGYKIEKIQ